jgi:hypothetical protein
MRYLFQFNNYFVFLEEIADETDEDMLHGIKFLVFGVEVYPKIKADVSWYPSELIEDADSVDLNGNIFVPS